MASVTKGVLTAKMGGDVQLTARYQELVSIAQLKVDPFWDPAALAILAEADKLDVVSSDSLPWTGKLSEAIWKAGFSIRFYGTKTGYSFTRKEIYLPESTKRSDPLSWAPYMVHEAVHGFLGSKANHTCNGVVCPVGYDLAYHDGGAYTYQAWYAKRYIERVGDGVNSQMKAAIHGAAFHIQNKETLPDWMKDTSLVLSANGR